MTKKVSLIPETPARRVPVEFDYVHSAPRIVGDMVSAGDRPDELAAIRDAADGVIRAIKSGVRDGLCPNANGTWLCTRSAEHEPPCVTVSVKVVAHAIWLEVPDGEE